MYDDQALWKYLDGEMSPDEASALERAAESDPEIARRLEAMREIGVEMLAGAPEPPADFAERVAAAAVAAPPAGEVLDLAQARRMLRRALVAAAVLAAISLTYLGFRIAHEFIEPAQAGGLLP